MRNFKQLEYESKRHISDLLPTVSYSLQLMEKKAKRLNFKGISLEQKWKQRNEPESFTGSKSGGKFMQTIINEKGQNRFS